VNAWLKAWLLLWLVGGLTAADGAAGVEPAKEKAMNIQITSSAFAEGQPMPKKYTCDDQDVSPPLKWSGAPKNTASFALIVDDPDAPVGTWVHWVFYDMPPSVTELTENVPKSPRLPNGAHQGINDFRRVGYGGPCPPPGKAHRYCFTIYALDRPLGLKPGATKGSCSSRWRGTSWPRAG
jgi:Raf kinase inhibitor-like YbhB/YbcL family protein